MQIAQILSDLNSLRVCDHNAAINLVNAHKDIDLQSSLTIKRQTSRITATPPNAPGALNHNSTPRPSNTKHKSDVKLEGIEADPDLQRAIDLVDLHYGVKVKHMQGSDMGLQRARSEVQGVMEKLRMEGKGTPKSL
ncbi:hypothetical protein MMC06_005218 [Schaereria dolodes]|nr:hypothetical protein [Schaereria dolodes]